MVTARLRKVGGSIMVAVPSAFVEAMDTRIGEQVEMELNGKTLSIRPANRSTRPKYRLADLLAKCDPTVPWSEEQLELLDAPPVGGEMV